MGQIDESVSIFEACEKSAACRRKTKLVSRRIKHYEHSRTFVDESNNLRNLKCLLMTQTNFEDFFLWNFCSSPKRALYSNNVFLQSCLWTSHQTEASYLDHWPKSMPDDGFSLQGDHIPIRVAVGMGLCQQTPLNKSPEWVR
jgi:hypothetical protein